MKTPERAGIYCRISSDPTGEAAGVARQQADCEALARSRGWPVAEIYTDNDISAFNGKTRAAYQRLLQDMQDGRVDAVVVWHEDRLHRQPRELEHFIDVANAAKVQLATVTGDIDLGSPEGRLRARMLGSVGAYESEHKAARVRRKHLQIAQDGAVSGGGLRPFGYEPGGMVVRESEAKLIRSSAKRVLAGERIGTITREWNEQGIPSTLGKQWPTTRLRTILCSARIAGMREHHGEIVAKAAWPAIITRAESDRLRRILRDPSRRVSRGRVRYLLTGGIAGCGLCGRGLVARPRADKRRCYRCAKDKGGCGKIVTLADPLEALVVEELADVLETPAFAKALRAAAAPKREEQPDIEHIEAQLVQLAQDEAEERISRREWLAKRDVLQRRLDDAQEAMGRANRTTALRDYVGQRGALLRAWPKLGIDRRRAIIAAAVDRVVVSPAIRGQNWFNPDRIAVQWRF